MSIWEMLVRSRQAEKLPVAARLKCGVECDAFFPTARVPAYRRREGGVPLNSQRWIIIFELRTLRACQPDATVSCAGLAPFLLRDIHRQRGGSAHGASDGVAEIMKEPMHLTERDYILILVVMMAALAALLDNWRGPGR